MQRICAVGGGIKSYLESPDQLVNDSTRECPFCAAAHALRLHGWYERWVITPDPEPELRITVQRLLCAVTGQTVSLLPDFCLPRRQHGPEVLGRFVWGLVEGLGLGAAWARVRRAGGHGVAQHLVRGFLRRTVQLQAYLATRCARAPTIPEDIATDRRELARLVLGLVAGGSEAGAAFRYHGRPFHHEFGVGLA
jgi:hypothetical protein